MGMRQLQIDNVKTAKGNKAVAISRFEESIIKIFFFSTILIHNKKY